MSIVLVCGASGYIGSHLVMSLLETGYEVIGFDIEPFPLDLPENYKHIRGDLLNLDSRSNLDGLHWEAVFHLATSSDMSASFRTPTAYLRDELSKTNSLLELAAENPECKRIIFASSCSVYGDIEGGAAPETHSLNPQSPYARAKVVSESAIEAFTRVNNLSSGVFRFFNVIGEARDKGLKENHTPESHILPRLVHAVTNEESFQVFGNRFETKDGTAIRDYIDVRDICRAIVSGDAYLQAFQCSQQIWNLGSNLGLTVLDLVHKVEEILGKRCQLTFGEARIGDPARALALTDKAGKELGWRPIHDLESSIRSILTPGEVH